MVASGTKEILLQWGAIVKGEEKAKSNNLKKPFGQEIIIGRGEENDVAFPSMFMFISSNNGKIQA